MLSSPHSTRSSAGRSAARRPGCRLEMPAELASRRSHELSVPQRFALALVRGYQLLLSPVFAGSCRFTPSCSHYGSEAIRRFGVVRGGYLAVRRLLRCHPLGSYGLDPVPDMAPPAPRAGMPRRI